MVTSAEVFLPRSDLDKLFAALATDGRRIIGPTIADNAVVYDELKSPAALPHGRTAHAAPGTYRLHPIDGSRAFDYGVALTSWKRFTHPSIVPLTRGRRDGASVVVESVRNEAPALAFVGV